MCALLTAPFALWVTVGMVRIAERGVRVEQLLLVSSCRSLDSCGIRHLCIPLPDSSATVTRSEWSCRRSAGTRLAILPVPPEVEVMCETQQCAKGAASLRVRPSHDTSALCPRTVPERDPERDPARSWPSMELRRLFVLGFAHGSWSPGTDKPAVPHRERELPPDYSN